MPVEAFFSNRRGIIDTRPGNVGDLGVFGRQIDATAPSPGTPHPTGPAGPGGPPSPQPSAPVPGRPSGPTGPGRIV